MNNVIEINEEEQFAKGQDGSDLRTCHDARDVETQLMDAIDSPNDFFRFLQLSTRIIKNNQRRH
jgi:hypothetical protein